MLRRFTFGQEKELPLVISLYSLSSPILYKLGEATICELAGRRGYVKWASVSVIGCLITPVKRNKFSRHRKYYNFETSAEKRKFDGYSSIPVQYVPPEPLRWEKRLIYACASLPRPPRTAGEKHHPVEVTIPALPNSAAQSASSTVTIFLRPPSIPSLPHHIVWLP